jgi:hypothetical protein
MTPAPRFYRLPEPRPGEPVFSCVRALHWGYAVVNGAELVLVATPGDVTSDESIVRRFPSTFRPLARFVQ